MKYSIEQYISIYPSYIIKISSRSYLKSHYENLGFVTMGENYSEDAIQHCSMIYLNQ